MSNKILVYTYPLEGRYAYIVYNNGELQSCMVHSTIEEAEEGALNDISKYPYEGITCLERNAGGHPLDELRDIVARFKI